MEFELETCHLIHFLPTQSNKSCKSADLSSTAFNLVKETAKNLSPKCVPLLPAVLLLCYSEAHKPQPLLLSIQNQTLAETSW